MPPPQHPPPSPPGWCEQVSSQRLVAQATAAASCHTMIVLHQRLCQAHAAAYTPLATAAAAHPSGRRPMGWALAAATTAQAPPPAEPVQGHQRSHRCPIAAHGCCHWLWMRRWRAPASLQRHHWPSARSSSASTDATAAATTVAGGRRCPCRRRHHCIGRPPTRASLARRHHTALHKPSSSAPASSTSSMVTALAAPAPARAAADRVAVVIDDGGGAAAATVTAAADAAPARATAPLRHCGMGMAWVVGAGDAATWVAQVWKPCRCLCRASDGQMTNSLRPRRTTLHEAQMRRKLARTFMVTARGAVVR